MGAWELGGMGEIKIKIGCIALFAPTTAELNLDMLSFRKF
jgi:hypothetical protein